jgi:hypothetical protein
LRRAGTFSGARGGPGGVMPGRGAESDRVRPPGVCVLDDGRLPAQLRRRAEGVLMSVVLLSQRGFAW